MDSDSSDGSLLSDEESPPGTFADYLKCRFCCEWRLALAHAPEWVCEAFFISYINQYVFRTLGFIRHRQLAEYIPESWCAAIASSPNRPSYWNQGDTCTMHAINLKNNGALLDVIQEIFPNEDSNKHFKLAPEAIEGLTIVIVCFTYLFGSLCRWPSPKLGKRPYICAMLTRCLRLLTIVFAMRPLLYLATSIPGPAQKCVGLHEWEVRPRNVWEIFYNFGLGSDNCGDLIYSGHISSLMVLVCSFFQYGRVLLDPQTYLYHVGRVVLVLLMIVQSVLIVMARNHYTVDTVSAGIIAAMAWRLYDHEVGPDAEPSQFLKEYRENAKHQKDTVSKLRNAELLAMTDEEFAEHVQYKGSVIGGIIMVIITIVFFGFVGITFAAMITG